MARGAKKAANANPRQSKSAARPQFENESPESREPAHISNHAPVTLRQKCLDVFRDALSPAETSPDVLQEVKSHLYNRDFAAAFGQEKYLRAYASRWSPSRALGYLEIMIDVQHVILGALRVATADESIRRLKLMCLGGGAGAEVVAVAAWLNVLQGSNLLRAIRVDARFIDIAAWGDVVADLHKAIVNPPELSKYASATAKETNVALLSASQYDVRFEQLDVLAIDDEASKMMYADADLVTLMFTLNELYTTSMPKTQKMLAHLTATLRPGALLLVVDSPGSYSTVAINGAEKKYPMQWLLDYTLIGALEKSRERPAWEKLVTDESKWFRLPQDMKYPIELENMRYQIHLYRRLAGVGDE